MIRIGECLSCSIHWQDQLIGPALEEAFIDHRDTTGHLRYKIEIQLLPTAHSLAPLAAP